MSSHRWVVTTADTSCNTGDDVTRGKTHSFVDYVERLVQITQISVIVVSRERS